MSNKDLNNSNLESELPTNSFQRQLLEYKNNPEAQEDFRKKMEKYTQNRENNPKKTALLTAAAPEKNERIEEIRNQIETINSINKSDFETVETPIFSKEKPENSENNTKQESTETIHENQTTPQEIAEPTNIIKESLALVEEINRINNTKKEELRKFLAEGGYKTKENKDAMLQELKAFGIAVLFDIIIYVLPVIVEIPADIAKDIFVTISGVAEFIIRKLVIEDYRIENKSFVVGTFCPYLNPTSYDLLNKLAFRRYIPTKIYQLKDEIEKFLPDKIELTQIEGKTKIPPRNIGKEMLQKHLKPAILKKLDSILDFQFENNVTEKGGDFIRFSQLVTAKKIKETFTIKNILNLFINNSLKKIGIFNQPKK